MSSLVQAKNVTRTSSTGGKLLGKKSVVYAVNRIPLDMVQGETFSTVGEPGCGKPTTACLANHLLTPDSNGIWFGGKQISAMSKNRVYPLREDMQMIFQDPNGSLNPRMQVEDLVAEPLLIHTNFSTEERLRQARELLEIVDPSARHACHCPCELSGGQRRRVGITRTLTVRSKLIIVDELASSLDVSIRTQVLNLTQRLQAEFQLTYLFISHGLSVVGMISDRIVVMYLGCIAGIASGAELYSNPQHPYTGVLLPAVPIPDLVTKRERILLQDDILSAVRLPKGCLFHARYPLHTNICHQQVPEPQGLGDGHVVACRRT